MNIAQRPSDNYVLYAEPVRGRSCASCKLCCTLLPVQLDDGWNKAGEPCKHLCSKGCGIYPTRPKSCVYWSCRWLFDPATSELKRPDKTHYVIDAMPEEIRMTEDETGKVTMLPVLQIWVEPNFPEAWRDPALLAYLDDVGRNWGMAALIRYGSAEAFTVFPPSLSDDHEWHVKTGSISTEIGLYSAHAEGQRPPLG